MVEPQAQVIYVDYSADDITETNGTRIRGADSSGVITRLGARVHRTYVRDDGRKVQPYAALNWWHTSTDSNMSFNQLPLGSLYPSNRYELKLGINADFGKRWTGWANVDGAWGAQSFYQYAVRAGVKYSW
ncbi:Outer membrane protein IcsA autotransporter precursor [compost metagenome]